MLMSFGILLLVLMIIFLGFNPNSKTQVNRNGNDAQSKEPKPEAADSLQKLNAVTSRGKENGAVFPTRYGTDSPVSVATSAFDNMMSSMGLLEWPSVKRGSLNGNFLKQDVFAKYITVRLPPEILRDLATIWTNKQQICNIQSAKITRSKSMECSSRYSEKQPIKLFWEQKNDEAEFQKLLKKVREEYESSQKLVEEKPRPEFDALAKIFVADVEKCLLEKQQDVLCNTSTCNF
jgi:hypothetical protein